MTGVLKFPENVIATLFLLPHGVCRSTGNFLLIKTLRRVPNVIENLPMFIIPVLFLLPLLGKRRVSLDLMNW